MDLANIGRSLEANLLAPIPLCFALGVFCKLIHGGVKIPKDLYYSISIYLLMAIGFIGGHELAGVSPREIYKPALVTFVLGCLTPLSAFAALYYLGRFSVADSAGIAAHYGSTSAVTFAVAQQFAEKQGNGDPTITIDKYIQTLVTVLECPGIAVALLLGAAILAKQKRATPVAGRADADRDEAAPGVGAALYEVVTGQSLMLMAGLLAIGFIATKAGEEKNLAPFVDFFSPKRPIFRGALCVFLLEMGLVAGERLADLKKAGPFLIGFGIALPILHGCLGAWLGVAAGMHVGTAAIFAAIVSSASYIAAPPAVRLTLPEANPTLSITASLAVTFPFNIALGIPLYFALAKWFAGAGATPG